MDSSSGAPQKPARAKWLISRDEVERGPFTSRQLQEMAIKGDLLPSDFLWKEGMSEWIQADTTSVVFPTSNDQRQNIDLPEASEEGVSDPELAVFLSRDARPTVKKPTSTTQLVFPTPTDEEDATVHLEDASSYPSQETTVDDASLKNQSKFNAVPGEKILFKSMAAWSEGIATHSGTVFLTTRRIAFCQPAGFDAGLLLIHTINLATRAHDEVVWQVLLSEIATAHRKKHLGFGRKTVVTARDGSSYALIVDSVAWRSALRAAGIGLTDSTGDPALKHQHSTAEHLTGLVPARPVDEGDMGEETGTDEEWHLNAKGESHGPISYSELQRLGQAGEIAADDLVWKEGMEKWALASSVPGLIPVPRKPKGPPPITEVERPSSGPKFESFVFDTVQTARKSAARVSHARPVKGFHVQRLIVGVASGLGIISTFLPWARIPMVGTIDGTFGGDGWITLALYSAAVVCVFREPHGKMFEGRQKLVAGICPIVASLIGLYTLSNIGNARRAIDDDNLFGAAIKGSFHAGIGLYLVVLCGIVAGLAVFALPQDRRPGRK